MVLPDLHVPRAKLLLISNCHRLKKKQTNIFFSKGGKERKVQGNERISDFFGLKGF
jgi:hypothetical protein